MPASGTEFDGVIEMSTLTGTRPHLAYAMHYCARGSDQYRTPDEEVARRRTAQLPATYPDRLGIEDVAQVRVFKAPFVEPVHPLGYADAKPAVEVPGTRPVLATTARIYPEFTSRNSSTGLSNRVVDDLPARTGTPVPAEITLA